jgi:hypothetical protein
LLTKPARQRLLLGHVCSDQEWTELLATRVVPVLKENPDAMAAVRAEAKQHTIIATPVAAVVDAVRSRSK